MSLQNKDAVRYPELTDEHIKDVKRKVEMFVKSEQYWDRFAHHSNVPRGHKEFTSRRLIRPKVRPEDVKPRAELIAPRAHKMAVATFTKTVENYGDKAIYTREDMQYHFDDTVGNLSATLQEIAIQKLDFIKGAAFLKSKAIITPIQVSGVDNMIKTAERAAIILRKNGAKRWDGTHYLAHITLEALGKLRAEVEAKGSTLTEKTKKDLEGRTYDVYEWGDFSYSVTTSDLMYKDNSHQYIVYMGRRGIDGSSPVDVAKLNGESGIELINNKLGSGVLEDEDGNLTSDDNKQQGSIAINMDGLGAAVADDLCILNCVMAIDKVDETVLDLAERTGYVSTSPASTLAIAAVAAADGTAVSSPTITVKKKNSSGTAVNASSGKYPVVAGDKYYVKVEKTNFTTVELVYTANAGDNTLTVVMAASN